MNPEMNPDRTGPIEPAATAAAGGDDPAAPPAPFADAGPVGVAGEPVGVAGSDAVVVDRPVRPVTGDEVVDAVLEQFDQVTGEPLDIHIEAAERAHRDLQGRLSDPGQA